MRRILDQYDGITEYFEWDEENDRPLIRIEQDIEPVLKAARAEFNNGGSDRRGSWWKIAEIPISALRDYARIGLRMSEADILRMHIHGWAKQHELICSFVHDRDMSGFRTMPGDYRTNFKRRRG